jgi:hypothetical protein
MEILARWGLASVGVSFALVGVLAFLAAIGAGGGPTDRQGALARVARTGWGVPLLIVVAIGFAGYAIWRFALAITGHTVENAEKKNGLKRIGYAARGVFYSGLTIGTIRVLFGSGGSGGPQHKETAKVLSWPGGAWIVGVVGIAFVGAGLFNGYRAITRKYLEQLKTWDIPEPQERVVQAIAAAGMFTRMLLFSIIGWFLIQAAVDHDPNKAVGLDGALRKVASETYGRVLLGIVAVGLLSYALYRAVEARYRIV